MTAFDAERRAEIKLEWMRPQAIAEIDAALAALVAWSKLDQPGVPPLLELRRHAYEIASVAATFGMAPIGDGAFSLCELLDLYEERPRADLASIYVHIEALGLLRRGLAPIEQHSILAGLRSVVERCREDPA